jgi:hypothetical protein
MKYHIRIYLIILYSLFFIISYPLYSDVTFNLDIPGFSFSEIENIETLLDEYFDDYNASIENDIQKKDMMKAFSEANSFTFSAIAHPATTNFQNMALSLDMTVSTQLFSFDYEDISLSLVNATNGEDTYLGFGLQLFTCTFLFYPEHLIPLLSSYTPNLLMGINLGGADFFYTDYHFQSFNIGVSLFYPLFEIQELVKVIKWSPLTLATGFSYFSNKIIRPVHWEFIIPLTQDHDNSDATPDLTGNAEIMSDPDVGICSDTFVIPITAVTSIDIGWFCMLDLGLGFDVLLGKSYISIDDEADIVITGELKDYVLPGTNGTISISGSINENTPDFIRFKVSAALGFHIDPVWIKVPVTYYFNYGISAGIKMGINY